MRFPSPKFAQSGFHDEFILVREANPFAADEASFGGKGLARILAAAMDWPEGSIHEDLVLFPVHAPFEGESIGAGFASVPAETVFGGDGRGGLLLGPMDWPEGTGRDGLFFFPTLLPLGTDPLPADAGAAIILGI